MTGSHRMRAAVTMGLLAWLAPARPAAGASGTPPDWLRDAVAMTVPADGPRVDAVVLLRDRTFDVKANGTMVTTERGAIRVVTHEGRVHARCAAVYLTDGGRITGMRAWLLPPRGESTAFGKKECVDARLDQNDVYNESRVRGISAADQAPAGAVFGYEWTREERSIFHQFDWTFQDRQPVRVSRVTVRVPEGWRARGIVMNHDPIPPEEGEGTLRWELRDLPAVEDEPGAPPLSARAARVAVSIIPGSADHPAAATAFESWGQVSAWLAALADPQAALNDRLRARALELVAGRTTELQRIGAIGAHVQRVNYVSIQTGVGRGGGYRPHAASLVLEEGYGDCKDKANLMRALLAAIDIPAWLVSIYSGDPTFVREEWPSPQQFNHCIVAIRAPQGDSLATRLDHPTLGPLFLFDPTDPWTPLGGLPESQQGSLALVVRPGETGLIRVPVTPPASNVMRRTVEVEFQPGGRITADIHESSTGTAARAERAWRHGLSETEYRLAVEEWVTRGMAGAQVQRVEAADDPENDRFELDLQVTAERYGKPLSGGLHAICPALVSRREWLQFTDSERTLPIVLQQERNEERVTIELPPSFEVEEFPEAAVLESDFAGYRSSYTFRDGRVHFTRTLEIMRTTLPPGRYAEVQRFFRAVRRAETALVLLRSGS